MQFLYLLESIRNPVLDAFFSVITYLGDEIAFLVLAIIIYWCVGKKQGLYIMLIGLGGTLINQFLKLSFRVPRPWVKDPAFTIVESAREGATGYSFPSGHTQTVTTTMGGIARFSSGLRGRVLCIVLLVLTALSRMYLGVHTPTDVLVSLAIGTVLVFALWPLFEKSEEKPALLYMAYGIFALLTLVYVFYVNLKVWPADVDEYNLEHGIKNGWTLLGCSVGILVSLWLERRYVNFNPKAPFLRQIPKVLIGLILTLAIKEGTKPIFKLIFGDVLYTTAIRYFLVVVFAAAIWPITFGWFAKGCPLSSKAKKALKRAAKIALIVILILAVLLGLLYWFVTRETKAAPISTTDCTNPLITPVGVTMLSGHRAGGGIAPENTMAALKNCVENGEYELDIFEFDLRMTSDGELVLLHDSSLDRTSNAVEHFGHEDVLPGDYTLAQLKELNMGESFVSDDGVTPYYVGLRGEDIPDDLRIITIEETLDYLEAEGDYRYIIEIKNSGETGYAAVDKLYDTLRSYGCLERTVVGTFNNEVTEYMDANYPDLHRSAGFNEAIKFYLYSLVGLKVESFPYVALQIPTDDYVVNLGTSRLVNYAHSHNIAVQYWTINDAGEMAYLQSIGADAVMTDVPDLGAEILNQP